MIDDLLLGEPSGRTFALVQFGGALAFTAMLLYSWIRTAAFTNGWLLFVIAASTMSGIAESLPAGRRRTVVALRVGAILALAGLLVVVFVAPDLVVG
jgi:uncharacterized membrane protein